MYGKYVADQSNVLLPPLTNLPLINTYLVFIPFILQPHCYKPNNMIEDKFRYYAFTGYFPARGPSTWYINDFDQRRVVSVKMDGESEDESFAIEQLRRYNRLNELPLDVYGIYVSHSGEIISMYTDAKDDQTCCVHYPFLHEIFVPEGIQTVRRDELEELERLGPDADLVAYPPCLGGSAKKVSPEYRS